MTVLMTQTMIDSEDRAIHPKHQLFEPIIASSGEFFLYLHFFFIRKENIPSMQINTK
jgi:hypothetical protein